MIHTAAGEFLMANGVKSKEKEIDEHSVEAYKYYKKIHDEKGENI